MTGGGEQKDMTSEDQFWLFGYGSLIWKPPPHFEERIPGYITGYVRRFWQVGLSVENGKQRKAHVYHSEDHRGVPEAPGRVVTLIERSYWDKLDDVHGMADDRVWGVAYQIKPSKVEEVKEYLDIREVGGYSIHYEPFHSAEEDKSPFQCLVYIGLPNNPQFLGVQDPQEVAKVISVSIGPSGENTEYLFQLEESLNDLGQGSGDDHVHDLSRRVRLLKKGESPLRSPKLTMANGYVGGTGLTKVGSTDEQEEIEKES